MEKSLAQKLLTDCWQAGIDAALPIEGTRPDYLPAPPKGRTVLIGAGKGVAQWAKWLEQSWEAPLSGVVVTRYGFGVDAGRVRVLEAAHPVPDQAGLDATKAIRAALLGLTKEDLVIALMCGGGSALLPDPPKGLCLEDEQILAETLLSSGAPIGIMNVIRQQVSGVKGGQLGLACAPAKQVSLVVSDVPGYDPAQVASGPTVPNYATATDALAAIKRYNMALPVSVIAHLCSGKTSCPTPDHPWLGQQCVQVIASSQVSLQAAAAVANRAGIEAHILSDAIEGHAADIGGMLAAIAVQIARNDQPFVKPTILLSGGEVTVSLGEQWGQKLGKKLGGPNAETALAMLRPISGFSINALCADTDGIDGMGDHAGAWVDGSSFDRMWQAGIDPLSALAEHDSHAAFSAIGDLFCPGATGTNVNDFRAVLITNS